MAGNWEEAGGLLYIECDLCMRFRREADKAKHKCVEDRAKPVKEQEGSVGCVGNGSGAEEA